MIIHVLPPDVAAKIAAGEVVERPANIAKELIENSLDAGASEIRIEVREGGQRLLRVSDNGHGIPAAEAPLAFQRHATSKLNAAEDLDRIETLGFRGEALYSIAAVSNVTLTSRHAEAEIAVQLRLEGGELVEQGRAGAPVGTVVTVEHLFHNVPARRKFLRTTATEAGRIAAIVQCYALAYPACRFVLVNEGRETFRTTGSGDLFDVIVQVYGLDTARQMIPFGPPAAAAQTHTPAGLAEEVAFMPESPAKDAPETAIRAFGYASLPTLTRANRTGIDLFVNRRYVEDRGLTFAVVQAYHTLLPVGRYPLAVVFVELDPGQVDVNVHPQKTQVRFVHERSVFSAVQKAVRRAVVQHAPIPDMDLPSSGRDAIDAWSARRRSIIEAGDSQRSFTLAAGVPSAEGTLAPDPALESGAGWASQASDDHEAVATPAATSAAEQDDASAGASHAVLSEQTRKLPPLRVVGQVGAMYIVAEGPEGVFLIDQHAAHERILYEKFMAQRGGGIAAQHLLEPVTLHVGREITGLVAQHLAELNRIGFAVEPFGGDSFLLRSIPSVLSGQDPARVLQEIASSLAERRNLVGEEMEARLVKMVCKRAAIKAGQLLSAIEMQELVRQLEACDSPRTCPHGRPTMIQLSAGELEKAFGRI
jgi:DNA mismatch repair protein MutL